MRVKINFPLIYAYLMLINASIISKEWNTISILVAKFNEFSSFFVSKEKKNFRLILIKLIIRIANSGYDRNSIDG